MCVERLTQPKIQRLVHDKLFPALGVVPIATWAWLKLTAPSAAAPCSACLVPWGGARARKPYELLMIGAQHPAPHAALPPRHVIGSVPLGHSVKPCVVDLLLPHGGVVVELFARHTSRGDPLHVSVGHEAWCGQVVAG